ncbi:lpha-acetolactate decarboxylase [Diaporthe amygdali]|uniref:lpha-acetolactate decarboxylase n=1 Tax=Phomopsis amygdali TaxID=1214568 RepID=UPI0022FE8C0D|nr:lpha-acetolactate decarboxylase [Diaporthe amygdali]KAJ0107426.1 lpha-acetolactate decarboxylase [Diaporthe amygdali]
MAPNELYQYSVVNALMDGVANKGLLISTLLQHGDHGIGTFRHMVGELIVVNGEAYQMKSDGSVTTVDTSLDSSVVAPFAMATHFEPAHATTAVLADKADLFGFLSFLLPEAHNLYLAVRISGVFKSITVRTVGGQSKPGEGLAEVGKHQTSHTFEEPMEGVIIGSGPQTTCRATKGGHLLALASDGEVNVEVAPISKFHLELPVHDEDFNEAELKGDVAGIAAVEG